MHDLWLALEGGGSKTRMLLADSAGHVLAREQGIGASKLYLHPDAFAETVGRDLRRLRDYADSHSGRITRVGLGGPMNSDLVEGLVHSVFGPVEIHRFSEGEIALAAAGRAVGISVVAGTGSSARAIDESGKVVDVGGFGPQFDDEGSGYWIGKEGIAAAARDADGRDRRSQLFDRVLRYFGLPDLWALHDQCDRNGHLFVPRVAAFAEEVFDAARQGDAVAIRICNRAGKALANLVFVAAARSNIIRRPIPVVLTGGVFHAGGIILQPLRETLGERDTSFEVLPPITEPAEGIFRLLAKTKDEDHDCVRD